MKRILNDHLVGAANEKVTVAAMDEPGQGGASHHYELRVQQGPERGIMAQTIRFQDGAISKPEDVNGITNEALLAVLIDRLRGFQGLLEMKTGKQGVPSRENAIALTKLEEALLWLQKRTRDRLARGVEGQNKA